MSSSRIEYGTDMPLCRPGVVLYAPPGVLDALPSHLSIGRASHAAQRPATWANLFPHSDGDAAAGPAATASTAVDAAAPSPPCPTSHPAPSPVAPLLQAIAAMPRATLPPFGIANPNNLCFMNATLQAVFAAPHFCGVLRELAAHTAVLDSYGKTPTLLALAHMVEQYLQPLAGASDHTVVPAPMMPVVQRFVPQQPQQQLTLAQRLTVQQGKGGRLEQQDAQEFFTYLLDHVHQELMMLQQQGPVNGTVQADPGRSSQDPHSPPAQGTEGDGEWLTIGRKQRSATSRGSALFQGAETAASRVFGGALQSTLKCEGSKPSETVQPFTVLHLDIQSPRVHSVEDALDALTAREVVQGYRATPRAAEQVAHKTLTIKRLPEVLVLHVMRFTYSAEGMTKLHKPLAFGPKLTLKPSWMAPSLAAGHRPGVTFTLLATVSHHGRTPSSGHYTADVKQADGSWLRFDDSAVYAVPEKDVCDEQAYLLFFQQGSRQ